MTMGTCELLRLPEVQACIKTDFLLLPCDLICEIPGESLLEAWMVSQSSLGGSLVPEGRNAHGPITRGSGGEQGGRRGGLGLYYQTKHREESVKGEATDFVAIAPLDKDEAPAVSHPAQGPAALRFNLSKVVMSSPMDTIKEKMENDKGFLIRHSLVEKHAEIKMLSSYRDAHLYVFPYWIKDLARNEKLESVSEDLIGYWAKSGWQKGLADKLGMTEIFERQQDSQIPGETGSHDNESVEEEIDLQAMSTTKSGSINAEAVLPSYASRVKVSEAEAEASKDKNSSKVPPILAYVQRESAPFVRRVDSSALLLSTSLRLAKLPSIEEVGRIEASPFAHNQKIAHPEGIAQRCTVSKSDCLIAENVTVEQFAVIKESVIGSNCHISSGARLTRCVLMDGVTVGPKATLTNCIIGRRAKIGAESMLKECEVQDSYIVPEDTDSKNEKFMFFEGLDEEADMTDDNEDDMEL